MRRKLLIANMALLALAVAAGIYWRHQWREARTREQAVLQRRMKPAPPPPMSPLPAAPPVKAAGYAEIAEKMLFSKDRNPTVIVEAPPPPPPKPMPPLPLFHGLLNLGDGLVAIMSEKPGAEHRDFRPGEQVGPFKLLDVSPDEIVLEWDGKTITKKVEELLAQAPPLPNARSSAPAASTPSAPPAAPVTPAKAEPGTDLGGRGISACQKGDTSPAGTVADGMRKVIKSNPFGASCYWEPVK